jgi:hypothetical protein
MEQFPSVSNDPPPSTAYRDPFSVGKVLGESFKIFFKNLPAFLLMAVLIYSPLFIYAMTTNPLDMTLNEILWMGIILVVGGLVLQNLLTAAVTYGVVEQMAGRHASVGKSMAVGLRRMLPTFGLFIVMMICIGLGFIALIIPGFIVMCMLYVAVPALVIEQNGIGRALSRSAHLTKGYRWSMFALVILMIIINKGASWTVEHVVVNSVEIDGQTIVDPSQWKLYIGSIVGVMLGTGALGATISAVAYVLLRNEKDGVGVGELAKVFE